MSDFATMLPGFAALATALTGLQIFQQNSPAKMIDPRLKGRLEFRVIAVKPVNQTSDEIRYTEIPATHSQVRVTLSLDAVTTVAVGKQMSVTGFPLRVFELVGSEAVAGVVVPGAVTSVLAGDYFARFQAVDTGPVAAAVGELAVIDTPVAGWTAGTNVLAATPGHDIQLLMVSSGLRQMTIQVKFEGYDHSPGRDALYYLERLSNRLVWPSSLATLANLDLALTGRGTFMDLSKVLSAEDRQWSIGVKDFMFLAVVNDTPDNPDDNPSTWIEEVTFNSDTLDDEGGTPLVKQITGSVTRPPDP